MKKLIVLLLVACVFAPTLVSAKVFQPIVLTPVIKGCMDKSALNYNPLATVSDGSCQYGGGQYITTHQVFSDLYRPVEVKGSKVFVGILGSQMAPVKLLIGKTTTKVDFAQISEHKPTWTYHTFNFTLPTGRYYARASSVWQGTEVLGNFFIIDVK